MIRHLSSGGATGSPEMALDIQAITVDERRYVISTRALTGESDTGIGRHKRTARTIGGGAALGTIIGAIAGGGKGAAIGVLVGVAGGVGAKMLTRERVSASPPKRFSSSGWTDRKHQPERRSPCDPSAPRRSSALQADISVNAELVAVPAFHAFRFCM